MFIFQVSRDDEGVDIFKNSINGTKKLLKNLLTRIVMSKIGLSRGIKKSDQLYIKAKYIASGTSTFSRVPGVFPDGGAPKVLVKQKGCRVWRNDANQYIDMVMGCGPATLGHGNNKIDKAIKEQLDKGILFSMINNLEAELAEKLVKTIPSAEMVKFSKNASDVCAAAVRLSRFLYSKRSCNMLRILLGLSRRLVLAAQISHMVYQTTLKN